MATTGPKQLSNQRVSVEKITSSHAALHVVQLDSTGGIITGGAGSTQVSIKEILSSSGGSLIDSSNVSLGVTIRAGSAAGTEYTDGDVDATISGGAILFDNSSNTLRPVTLTRGLPVNVVAGSAASTTVQVSSVGGIVVSRLIDRDQSTQVAAVLNLDPPSTTYGLAVRQVGAVAASTTVQVSSVAGAVIIRSSAANALVTAYQSTAADLLVEPRLSTANINSSAYLPVRITDGTQFQALLSGFTDGSTTSTLTAPGVAFNNGSNATMRLAGSSTPLPVHLRTSSGADMGDSTNTALRVNVVAGSAASTTVNVSSLAGNVTVSPLSSGATGFFAVRVSDGSTFLQPANEYTDGSTVSTLTGGGVVYSNSSNNTMRLVGVLQPLPVQLRTGTLSLNSTTVLITSTHSTALYDLVSSAALRQKVYAFHVTSTHTTPSTLFFMSSNGSEIYHIGFGSGSSGVTGANLAVTPPAYLFATAVNEALRVKIEGGSSVTSTTLARVSFSYFSEA